MFYTPEAAFLRRGRAQIILITYCKTLENDLNCLSLPTRIHTHTKN